MEGSMGQLNAARQQLNIQADDCLRVDVQEDILILIRQPENYVQYMAGLHRDVWAGVDTTHYLHNERASWDQFPG
jgi:hypothetical protein